MKLVCQGISHFSDIYCTPKFGLSSRGEICFCNTNDGEPGRDKQRRFFLSIHKANDVTLQIPLPNPPAMIEGTLHEGISFLAPQTVNDHIYLGLAPEWLYGHKGSIYCTKLDWAGKILWVKEFPAQPFEFARVLITQTGRQFILLVRDKTKSLVCLSDQGEVLWTLQEKWLSKLSPWMYLLPDECVLMTEPTTKPAPGGILSKLYVINSDGKVIIKRNDFLRTAAQNNMDENLFAYYFHQSPVCPPQQSLVYFAPYLPYWNYDMPLKLICDPQTIALYYPLTNKLEKKEFIVGEVEKFLWDEKQQILFTCTDKKQDDIARIDFQKGTIQYNTYHGNHDARGEPEPPYKEISPNEQNNGNRRIIEPPIDYIHHCLPIMTEWGDVIFCHSGTSVVCMSPEWKEKWRIELSRGACDMKLMGNLLFIMIYNEVEHSAQLHKFSLTG